MSDFSGIQLFVTPWTVSCQAPLSMGFSRQEYWSKLPFPPPGDLPDPGTEPMSLMSPALAGEFFTASAAGKPIEYLTLKEFEMQQFQVELSEASLKQIIRLSRESPTHPRPPRHHPDLEERSILMSEDRGTPGGLSPKRPY